MKLLLIVPLLVGCAADPIVEVSSDAATDASVRRYQDWDAGGSQTPICNRPNTPCRPYDPVNDLPTPQP